MSRQTGPRLKIMRALGVDLPGLSRKPLKRAQRHRASTAIKHHANAVLITVLNCKKNKKFALIMALPKRKCAN